MIAGHGRRTPFRLRIRTPARRELASVRIEPRKVFGQITDSIIDNRTVLISQHGNLVPRSGYKIRRIMRSVVVFPDPLGPMNPGRSNQAGSRDPIGRPQPCHAKCLRDTGEFDRGVSSWHLHNSNENSRSGGDRRPCRDSAHRGFDVVRQKHFTKSIESIPISR